MQKLNFLQLFEELISNNTQKEEIIIEISAFNKFAKNIKEYNIICDFDYYDLEDYARLKPEISRIESTKITFMLSESWINSIKRIVTYYEKPNNYIQIIKVWETTIK